MQTNDIDGFGKAYLELVLEINQHLDGYVDAYFGPEEIKKRIELKEKSDPRKLATDCDKLRALIPENDQNRQKYLFAVVDAIEFMVRKLNGEKFEYLEQVEGLFGIKPQIMPEEELLDAHNILDKVISGSGSLGDRITLWEERITIPSADIPKAVERIMNEIRNRTRDIITLNAGESFDIDFVNDKPWGAYNHYLGDFKSHIEINVDIDWNPVTLTSLLAHEAYPGHHPEQRIKEQLLLRVEGFSEESCILLFTPKSIVTEGIANTAIDILSQESDIYSWISWDLIPYLNLPEVSAEELQNVHNQLKRLGNCSSNMAILYHTGSMDEKEAIEYLITYMLANEQRAKQSFRFATDPLYKTYIFTYTEGYRLIDEATSGKRKLPLFKRLLTEQYLPEDLIGSN